jgi:hypothetical protein
MACMLLSLFGAFDYLPTFPKQQHSSHSQSPRRRALIIETIEFCVANLTSLYYASTGTICNVVSVRVLRYLERKVKLRPAQLDHRGVSWAPFSRKSQIITNNCILCFRICTMYRVASHACQMVTTIDVPWWLDL